MNHHKLWTIIGEVGVIDDGEKLLAIVINPKDPEYGDLTEVFLQAKRQIGEYFLGDMKNFSLPLNVEGTKFQKLVWEELQKLPYGETISYKKLAIRVGYPNAARAVGTACKVNRFPIVIPCHRVINENGKIGLYIGGTENKEKLIKHERTWSNF